MPRFTRAATAALALLAAGGTPWAGPGDCFREDGKPPERALTGMLRQVQVRARELPAIDGGWFYVLDLPAPVCLEGAGGTRRGLRSVHVFAPDEEGMAGLRRHAGRRVTVAFKTVFEEHTAHHLRPMVGEVARVGPAP